MATVGSAPQWMDNLTSMIDSRVAAAVGQAPENTRHVYGVITQLSPLRVRLDGDSEAIGYAPPCLYTPELNDRVLCALWGNQVAILGPVGGPTPVVIPTDPNIVAFGTIYDNPLTTQTFELMHSELRATLNPGRMYRVAVTRTLVWAASAGQTIELAIREARNAEVSLSSPTVASLGRMAVSPAGFETSGPTIEAYINTSLESVPFEGRYLLTYKGMAAINCRLVFANMIIQDLGPAVHNTIIDRQP